ncbi:MAG TPA: hypothetical protein VFA20_26140 [Myxococcaceae bacterium]|nr:hypothetical protein [Myxococcaceae bacterium]
MLKRPNLVLGVICALVGCAAGMAGRSVAMAAEAPLPEPKAIHRWQGQCRAMVPSMSVETLARQANEEIQRMGDAGWELVSAGDGFLCFKRPAD